MTVALTGADVRPRASGGHAQSIRRHNRGVVLRTLLHETSASRADLARLTGLTRPTISEVVRDLLTDGVILEAGQSHDARPGKPAVMLEFDHDAAQIIAVDLSAGGIATAALTTPDGRILEHRVQRHSGAPGEIADAAVELATALADLATRPLFGVGVALPLSGRPAASDLALTSRLTEAIGVPVHLADDASLAAQAERRFGGEQDEFLLVRLGSRIGTTIGRVDAAPAVTRELAHVVAGGDPGVGCRCDRTGCVHAWAAAPALSRRLADAVDDAERRRLRTEAGTRLGTSLAVIASALDLPTIILSGPAGLVDADLVAATGAAVSAASQTGSPDGVSVRGSILPEPILLGAASLVVTAAYGVR